MPPSISPTTVQAENGIAHAHPSIPVEEVMRLSAAIDQVQTEDDQPVDNSLSERQMRLLVETLYDSWQPMTESGQPRRFYAQANVGVFYAVNVSPIVPDVMLVMDITVPEGYESKSDLSYFAWNYGKVPDVAIEIVSNKEGRRASRDRRPEMRQIGRAHV